MRLNKEQRKITGDILGNLAVGWFGAGIIVPLFTKQVSTDYLPSFLIGLGLFLGFYLFAILVVRK